MKNNLSRFAALYLAFLITLLVISACTEKRSYNYLDSDSIIATLNTIDYSLVALKGFEPKEPEYTPKEAPFGYPEQETFDKAAQTWRKFIDLCSEEKFQEAYNLYSEEGRAGDFMVCLKHSTPRFHFYTEVLEPMMYEFEPKDSADVKYMALLNFEYYMEDFAMQYGAGDNDYIPKTFPDISVLLGQKLAEQGRLDEAFELLDDYAYAVNGLTGNPAYTNFSLALFGAALHYAAGDNEQAIETLEGYKQFTSENKNPERDPAEYDYYFKLIDEAIGLYKEAK